MNTDDLDEVLYQFSQACPSPTPAMVGEWQRRHPEHAEEIRGYAAVMITDALIEAVGEEPRPEPSEDELNRGFDAVRLALHGAQPAAEPRVLSTLAEEADTTLPDLARSTGTRERVLADIDVGLMEPPLTGRLATRLAHALRVTVDAIQAAVRVAAEQPLGAEASTTSPPELSRHTYEALLRAAGMTDAEVAFWLAED